MFDTAYLFHLLDHKQISVGGSQLATWKYNFRSRRRRYIIEVELYKGPVYVIKYYAKCHALSTQKFNLLLKDEKPAPIIRTCINIMLAVYQRDSLASFGFIGSHKANTQRFRIYQTLMFNFFGTETFEHAQSVKHSAYLLINRSHHPVDQFKSQAEAMFASLYVAFEA